MERISIPARPDYESRLRQAGCHFSTMYGAPYMSETMPQPAAYRFTPQEVERITTATLELHKLALAVVEAAVGSEEHMRFLGIPEAFWDHVATSWRRGDIDLYQRFDLAFDPRDGQPKLIEFNGDTPTGVVEMNANLHWWQDATEMGIIPKEADVFNDLRFHLTERFGVLKERIGQRILHFAAYRGNVEEEDTVKFLQACANDAGLFTDYLPLQRIGVTEESDFADTMHRRIDFLFKLFPWEDMATGPWAQHFQKNRTCTFYEPSWKMVWSNKAFLALAWKLFPGHPNLLPAFLEGDAGAAMLGDHIRKPQWGREGQNMTIVKNGMVAEKTDGAYGDNAMVLQELVQLPSFDGRFPIIGSWVVNNQAAGVLIREDSSSITANMSACLPTFIL